MPGDKYNITVLAYSKGQVPLVRNFSLEGYTRPPALFFVPDAVINWEDFSVDVECSFNIGYVLVRLIGCKIFPVFHPLIKLKITAVQKLFTRHFICKKGLKKLCTWSRWSILMQFGSFSFSPTSHMHHFYVVTRAFTRLSMKIKYVCHCLISPHTNFCNNSIVWTKF